MFRFFEKIGGYIQRKELMRNLHLLPTPKSSRLVTRKFSDKLLLADIATKRSEYKRFNLYITGEEITGFENNIWVFNNDRVWLWENTMTIKFDNKPKIIVLTTDKDLIDSGVQAIDNTFLKWFVMKPTCDFVKVNRFAINCSCENQSKYRVDANLIKENSNSGLDNPLQLDDFIKEKKIPSLYSEIESLIIRWNLDGTKTAGSLTREIMKLL